MEAAIVADYREMASWRQVRLAVCGILACTQPLARQLEYRRMAKEIDRLSVSILENFARGFEGDGDRAFLDEARRSIVRLEQELARARRQKAISSGDALRLSRELVTAERSLSTDQLSYIQSLSAQTRRDP